METNTNSPLDTPSIPNLYSAIFQQTPIAFEVYDKDGLLVNANPACLKLFGVSCLSDIKKFPLFDDPNVSHEVKDQLLHGETVTYNTNFSFDAVTAHGFYPTQRSGSIEISVKISSIYDTKRVLTGYLCVISDMTEMKSTMNSLVESEQRYKSAFYDHSAVKLIIDPDSGTIIDANKAAVRFYGWSADQLKCMRIQDINTLTDEDLFKEMQNARNNNRTFFRFQHRVANGSVRDVEVFSSKMQVRGKELLHSIIHDVTDKKLAEEKQKALAEMLDIAPSSITIHDTDGNFLFSNQKTGELHGYTRDEFKGINLHDLDVPESETLLAERFSIIENVGEARFDVSHYRKDGTSFPLEVYAKKIVWEGKPALLSIATDITERVLAEEKIKSQNALLSMITQTSPVGIVTVDKTGSITYANARAEEILGIVKDEITSLTYDAPLWNHINIDGTLFSDEKQPFNVVKTTMSTAYDIQHGILWPDGNVVLLSINASPMKDIHDNFDGMLATIEDITKRKKAENKLQESEEKYRAAFMTSPDSVNINRLDGRYVDINEGFTGITGYMREDVIGKLSSAINIWSIPEDREKLVKGLKENGKVENLESVFKSKDGSLKTGLMSARIITLNNKPHILSVTRDITDRKKAEEALAVEKERLSVTLQSIGDGVITTNTNGNVVLLNKAAEEMTGWPSAEAAGRPLTEVFNIINEITRKKCENPVDRALATGEIVELANHTALVKRDNREIIIADSAAPIKAANGETIGVVLVFRDMTEKKKMETAVEVSSKLESLGILAGGIAHDFNNLLGGIYGYIDMASETSTDENVTRYLSKTMATIERARDLTGQLLTFAKGGGSRSENCTVISVCAGDCAVRTQWLEGLLRF